MAGHQPWGGQDLEEGVFAPRPAASLSLRLNPFAIQNPFAVFQSSLDNHNNEAAGLLSSGSSRGPGSFSASTLGFAQDGPIGSSATLLEQLLLQGRINRASAAASDSGYLQDASMTSGSTFGLRPAHPDAQYLQRQQPPTFASSMRDGAPSPTLPHHLQQNQQQYSPSSHFPHHREAAPSSSMHHMRELPSPGWNGGVAPGLNLLSRPSVQQPQQQHHHHHHPALPSPSSAACPFPAHSAGSDRSEDGGMSDGNRSRFDTERGPDMRSWPRLRPRVPVEKKREKNREAQRRFRDKQKSTVSGLEELLSEKAVQLVAMTEAKNAAEAALKEAHRRLSAYESVGALPNSHHVVTNCQGVLRM